MDFDFDAPGIPAMFELNAFKNCRAGGILDLAQNYMESIKSGRGIESLQDELAKRMISPQTGTFTVQERSRLKILPSGDASREDYWDTLLSDSRWLDFLTGPKMTGSKKTSVAGTHAAAFFNQHLKPALEEMKTDYLLIDSRAGITPYGRLSYAIADKTVVIFSSNDEAKHARSSVAKHLRDEWRAAATRYRDLFELGVKDRPPIPPVVLVLSRMPPELEASSKILEAWKKGCEKDFESVPGHSEVLPLHSDIQTHLDQKLRFPSDKTPEQVVIFHQDVLRILARLFPEDVVQTGPGEKVEPLANALWQEMFKRPFAITHVNRLFGLLGNRGEMLNPDDASRNVAFKVDTFLRFLNNFYDGFKINLKERDPKITRAGSLGGAQKQIDVTLTQAGHECGEAFGEALAKKLDIQGIQTDVKRIDEWCVFDTRAGFGHLAFESPDTLCVENIFLWKPAITRTRDFTAFFTGYASGVLTKILKRTVALKRIGAAAHTITYKVNLQQTFE